MITTISATEKKELAKLRAKPVIAWPTVILLITCLTITVVVWTLTLMDICPLWLAATIGSITGYLLFTPAHDGIHRCLARNPKVNELLLSLSVFIALPFGRGRILRLMHMKHHVHANEDADPDQWMVTTLWTMPLWGLWPYFYIISFLRDPSQLPSLKVSEVLRETLVASAVVVGLFILLPVKYMIALWLIPSYVAFFLMCVAFMILPHYPYAGKQSEDPNNTSLIRLGKEWLLTPLLMYQNYHLMHHLYPTIPFYRYGKAWKAREQYHLKHCQRMIIGPFELGSKEPIKKTGELA